MFCLDKCPRPFLESTFIQQSRIQMGTSIPREVDLAECRNSDEWKFIFEDQDGESRGHEAQRTRDSSIRTSFSLCSGLTSNSELKLPQLSDNIVERLFPVRSVISFDSKSSALHTPPLDKLQSPTSPILGAHQKKKLAGDKSEVSEEILTVKSSKTYGDERAIPKRPAYSTRMDLPKRKFSGSSSSSVLPTLHNLTPFLNKSHHPVDETCEVSNLDGQLRDTINEGRSLLSTNILNQGLGPSKEYEGLAIQPLGVLLVICESEKNLTVQIASDNSEEILGYSCDELFELKSICNILDPAHRAIFRSHAKVVLSDDFDLELCGPEVFSLSIPAPGVGSRGMWCTMHTNKRNRIYVICELEPDNHLPPLSDQSFQYYPCIKDNVQVSVDTARNTKPLESELLNALPCILQQISSVQSLEALIQHSVSSLRQLTGFDKVNMYHFDSDCNGIVIAGSINPSFDIESCEGIQFEELSFPPSTKKKYLRSSVAFSYRKSRGTARLAFRENTSNIGLDLSHCYLPVASDSLKYHTGSRVYAYMSIGITVFGKLWGLISCLSFTESFRLHPPVQRVCWLLGNTISSNIERLSYTLPSQVPKKGSFIGEVQFKTPYSDLLGLFRADYAVASVLDETKILGEPTDSQEALAMLEYLRAKKPSIVLWSSDIVSDFEDLDYSPGFQHLAGFLFVPLSTDGSDFIVFFRSDFSAEGFQTDRQTEWSAAEFGKASILPLLYRTFTEAWQEKEAKRQSNQLMRLLLTNAAHEFRTPLNAIINYLEIELDGNLNQETRENLSRSHSASKSLVYIINDLLDLTNAENGQSLMKEEAFSLSETLREATDIFCEEARQKEVCLQAVQRSPLPQVLGDQRRVRQVITNLIGNAVQYTSNGAVTIVSRTLLDHWEPGHIVVEVAIHDTGSGMSHEAVETLFCELEQVSNKGHVQDTNSYKDSSYPSSLETGSVLGLGLALVARIVRNMDGQLSLRSEEGKGSCFKLRLKFPTLSHDEMSVHSFNDWDSKSSGVSRDTLSYKNESPEKNVDIAYHFDDITLSESGQWQESNLFVNVHHLDCKNEDSTNLITANPLKSTESQRSGNRDRLNILVAEDDPINSSIVRKRLEKLGYSVFMTSNGKECAAKYRESPKAFDVVMMDLQMPIVDGLSATRMIREYELQILKQPKLFQIEPGHRIAVFAVSASLMEKHWPIYVDVGFDGWITKPIDFQRFHSLLRGVRSTEHQRTCAYQPGMWEHGGWFEGWQATSEKSNVG
ncbi:CheY-like superfamily [Penicillium taxi]|uniref:CheY-like superfamily n=1 Tax=Penicillium taxi TaxID=168475 RepID=UPI0025459AF5|nr:CheY-like superfamily [Penicillium taxi]KAJ5899360.1 CheY-like superfamily [Penicillium taxi]